MWSSVTAAASVTVTSKFEVPAVVGVPEMTPALLIASPAGSDPVDSDQLYGVVPPVAARVVEYAVPTVPPGSVVVEMASGAGFTVIANDWVAVPAAASVTLTSKFEVPAVVGVPEMTPALLIASPAGRVPVDSDQP